MSKRPLIPDGLIRLTKLNGLLPERLHHSTLYRWATKGRRVGSIRKVLRTLTIGGVKYTTAEWVLEFLASGDEPTASSDDCQRAEAANQALSAEICRSQPHHVRPSQAASAKTTPARCTKGRK